SRFPPVPLGASCLTPNRNYDVPAFDSIKNKDWTPKMGVAWDVFGDGKTATKLNASKYVLGQSLVNSNPLIAPSNSTLFLTATRPWTVNNANFIPDCDLTSPSLQG